MTDDFCKTDSCIRGPRYPQHYVHISNYIHASDVSRDSNKHDLTTWVHTVLAPLWRGRHVSQKPMFRVEGGRVEGGLRVEGLEGVG